MVDSGPATTTASSRTGLAARLQRHWWRSTPSAFSRLLQPLSWLYAALAWAQRIGNRSTEAPVPVLVVGNCVVGGAGKTPVVMAVVNLLQAAGHRPAVLSRGYGRRSDEARLVAGADNPQTVGDEPLLIHQKTGVPVWVGQDRAELARLACQHNTAIDVLVCDDGLQHHRLARRVNLVVFDERGLGNGLLLPAGPLRQSIARLQPNQTQISSAGPHTRVLYNASRATTPLPGALVQRSISKAWPLQDWGKKQTNAAQGLDNLHNLRGRKLLAVAGLGHPEKFFSMLEAAGLTIERLPLPDHHAYDTLPWPAQTPNVITTEKDAIKLAQQALGQTQVWVVPLDLQLPQTLGLELLNLLFATPHKTASP